MIIVLNHWVWGCFVPLKKAYWDGPIVHALLKCFFDMSSDWDAGAAPQNIQINLSELTQAHPNGRYQARVKAAVCVWWLGILVLRGSQNYLNSYELNSSTKVF